MRQQALYTLAATTPLETMRPFSRAVEEEICEKDNQFLCRVMKLDPMERPTSKELLGDVWFREELQEVDVDSDRLSDSERMLLA